MKSGNRFLETGKTRETIAAALLFLATATFVLWQNSQIAVLWDLSYLLDTSWRIALGQMPYRDFPLVHAPLTFLIQAVIMRVAGRHYFLQIGYAALVGGLGTVVAWRLILGTLRDRVAGAYAISLWLSAPMVVLGIYCVYPHPIYDGDCVFAVLVALLLLQRCARLVVLPNGSQGGWLLPVGTGAAIVAPLFFKQNIGAPFLLAVVAGMILLLAAQSTRAGKAATGTGSNALLLRILMGIGIVLAAAFAILQATAGLRNYFYWTIQFAAQRRLPGFGMILSAYKAPSLIWMLVCAGAGIALLCLPVLQRFWAQLLGFCLLAAPFAGSLIFLVSNDNPEDRSDNLLALWPFVLVVAAVVALLEFRKGITLPRLIPFFVLAAIQGTLLSQSLDGSTYAIWPLFLILAGGALAAIRAHTGRWLVPALSIVLSAALVVCGGLYATGHERMSYVTVPDEPVTGATWPPLRGMADRGPYISALEELVRFVNEQIPAQDELLILPGEDPFYFATGRSPKFPVLLFDPTTDPYSPQQLLVEARRRDIRWVIVKTSQQSTDDQMPDKDQTLAMVRAEFKLYTNLSAYAIYRR